LPPTTYKNLPDEDLMLRIAKHDQDAFATLYGRYAHLALGVCLKYYRNAAQAQDTVQVVFVKLWTDAAQFQIRKFKPWFYQVVKNQCLMELRKKNPEANNVAEWDLAEVMEFEDNLHHKIKEEQLLLLLEDCMRRLNEEQHSCVSHFYINQKSYSETALLTGFNDKQVKSNIQNGRRNLRICLQQKLSNP